MKRYEVEVHETFSHTYYIDAPDDADNCDVEEYVDELVNNGDIDTTSEDGYDRSVSADDGRHVSESERDIQPPDFTMED